MSSTDRLSIFVADGLRHRQLSGYGVLSRNLIFGLVELGHDVRLRASDKQWGNIERGAKERLQKLPQMSLEERESADLILQIRQPSSCVGFAKPTLVYTQNALGGLRPEWLQTLKAADGIIVPSEFDRAVFARHFPRVYVAGQSADAAIFKPDARRRAEGPELFSFLYVGSYSFRKGVDLLLETFLTEFDAEEPVELRLHCPGIGRGEEFNHCLHSIQRFNARGRVRLSGGELTPEWMSRLYNQSDCVLTLSRGEGWCMPLTEALLCEVPVIAPCSTGMAEYLDDSVAEMVSTRELPAGQAPTPFGFNFATGYGFPGVTYYEPDVAEARAAMRRVYESYPAAREKARAGRRRILTRFSWAGAAREVERACYSLLAEIPVATGG
jgi:glycosyltransferase involved in cell wall biosynthesis